MTTPDWPEGLGEIGAWIARAFKMAGLARVAVGPLRRRAALGPVRLLRLEVIEEVRMFDRHLARGRVDDAAVLGSEICKGAAKAMEDLLQQDEGTVNCLIKAISPDGPSINGNLGDVAVTTIGTSNAPRHKERLVPETDPLVRENSGWSAVCGVDDGKVNWSPVECFACPDLTKHGLIYTSHLKEWHTYYRSTAIFPLRFQGSDGIFYQLGLLVFESEKTKVFSGLPNIYSYAPESHLTTYVARLNNAVVFHYGMAMAEMLTAAMRRYWRERTGPQGRLAEADEVQIAMTPIETLPKDS